MSMILSSDCPLTMAALELKNSIAKVSATTRLTTPRTRSPLRMLQAKCFVRSMYG